MVKPWGDTLWNIWLQHWNARCDLSPAFQTLKPRKTYALRRGQKNLSPPPWPRATLIAMRCAQMTPHLTPINTIWQWLVLWSLMCMGWLSREQLEEMLSEAHDGALLVYDHNGKAHVFLPDAAPVAPLIPFDETNLMVLDVALMKPSCCDAPEGLCHFWFRPNCIGTLPTTLPGHPGQGARAADPGSPRGPIP